MKVGDIVHVIADTSSPPTLSVGIIVDICDFPKDIGWQPQGLDRLDYTEWPRKAAQVFVQGQLIHYLNQHMRFI